MTKKLLLFTTFLLLLSSCLMPHKFVAEIKIKEDQSIEIHYKGQMIHLMAHSAYNEESKPNAVDDNRLKREAVRIFERKEYLNHKYVGKGAFEVEILEEISFIKNSYTLPMLDFVIERDGSYSVGIKKLSDYQKRMLDSLRAEAEGKIRILLPPKAKVISHNADFSPWFFSDYYVWKISNLSASPFIKFNLF